MKCLCCGLEINDNKTSWHKRCIEKFFGTKKLPSIDLKDFNQSLNDLANKYIEDNKSVTGVQQKLSFHLSKEDSRLTILGYPQGYILKPNSLQLSFIAEAEHLVMSMADACGIKTTPHALIEMNGKYAYITKRIDRDCNGKIHMEDFCQLSMRPTEYKYIGSYEKCAKIIDKFSSVKLIDKGELFLRLCFCYFTGNSDMHLKNFSIIEMDKRNILSPAYDLLPVKLLINDSEDLALTLNGKKKNLTKNDFLDYADSIGLEKKVANQIIEHLVKKEEKLINMINESLIPEEKKLEFVEFLANKINKFK